MDDDSQSRPMHLSPDEDAAAVQVTRGIPLSTFVSCRWRTRQPTIVWYRRRGLQLVVHLGDLVRAIIAGKTPNRCQRIWYLATSFFVSPEATPEVLPGGGETPASQTLVFIALAFFFPEGLHYFIFQKGGGNHVETHPHVGICHGLGSQLWDGQGELQDTTVRATLRERQKVDPQQTGMTRERAPNKKGETSKKKHLDWA